MQEPNRKLLANISLSTIAERDFQVIFRLKEGLESLRNIPGIPSVESIDYTIIDGLPSFGHLHLAALAAADYVLIPVKPAPYALSGLKDLLTTIEKAKKYFNPGLKILGILINQLDGRNLIMEREMENVLRDTYKDMVLKTRIKKRVSIEESPAFQKPITTYAPHSSPAKDFRSMKGEILKRIKLQTKNGQ